MRYFLAKALQSIKVRLYHEAMEHISHFFCIFAPRICLIPYRKNKRNEEIPFTATHDALGEPGGCGTG